MDKNFYKKDEDLSSKKFVPTSIYPQVDFSFKEVVDPDRHPSDRLFVYELRTLLRVKHEGVWYGWKFFDSGIVPTQASQEMADSLISHALTRFHTNIYLAQLFGRVDLKLMIPNMKGEMVPVFERLMDQRDEKERLKEVFRLPFQPAIA